MAENNQEDIPTEQTGHFHRCASALHKTRLKFSPWRPPRLSQWQWAQPRQPLSCRRCRTQPCHQPQSGDGSQIALAQTWALLILSQPSFSLSPRRSLCLIHCPVVSSQNHSCWGGVQCRAVQSLFLLQIFVATPANCSKSSSSALQIFLIFFFFLPQLPFKSVATLEMQRE